MPISRRRFLTIAVEAGAAAGVSVCGLNRALASSKTTASDDSPTVSPQSLGSKESELEDLSSYA